MSTEKNRAEALRWLRTAEDDLETAAILMEHGRFAHSCFHCQQAAEKALKALWYFADADPWGHSAKKLIEELEAVQEPLFRVLEPLLPLATTLDRFYIPTRYPNGLPELTPAEAFTAADAASCLDSCRKILGAVRVLLMQ